LLAGGRTVARDAFGRLIVVIAARSLSLMVRSASSRVSNHEVRYGLILRDAAGAALQDEGLRR
jgi:hypothetical protein